MTPLADRYAGRHTRQARHGAWRNKKRARQRPPRQLLPAAAALTVAGLLIGGAGTVIQINAAAASDTTGDDGVSYDAADYPPPDRDAATGRASRSDARPGPSSAAVRPPSTVKPRAAVGASGTCKASYYDEGQRTANGETFNPDALTAAHRSLPFNSRVRVTNVATGESVVVRINDRGPFIAGRCLDLSEAAFAEIANLGAGVVNVRYEVLIADAT